MSKDRIQIIDIGATVADPDAEMDFGISLVKSAKPEKKSRATRELCEVNAAWATSSSKYVAAGSPPGSRPTYHVHPDSSNPHENAILTFPSLRAILDWCEMRRQQNEIMAGAPPAPPEAASEAEYLKWERKMHELHLFCELIDGDFWESNA